MKGHITTAPTLYIFSGLPGSGKTALAQRLATSIYATYLRIDTIEQAVRDICSFDVQGEGYALAYRIAADNLKLGTNVIADSCNPIELTRDQWERVALESQARYVNIEVVCSDENEHRSRVESRVSTVSGLRLPTWNDVQNREYHPWTRDRIVIDTSSKSEKESFDELCSKISVWFDNEVSKPG
jgi:predicted kinase